MYNPHALTYEQLSFDLFSYSQGENSRKTVISAQKPCMYVYFVVWTIWKWDTMTLDPKMHQYTSPKKHFPI